MLIEHNLELDEAFAQLSQSLIEFCALLKQSQRPLWLPLTEKEAKNADMHSKARDLYANIWHSGEGDGRLTVNCHGVIGASPDLISAAEQLNLAKDAFKQSIAKLNDKSPTRINERLRRRSNALAASLHCQGLSRLHLKQCYRHIPILQQGCTKLQFSWYCSGRSIKRISQQSSLELLTKLDQSNPHVQVQIEKLAKLRPESRLAQVQNQVPVMRVNALWPDKNQSMDTAQQPTHKPQWLRQARNVPLPILVPLQADEPLPEFNQPSLQPPKTRNRAIRSDSIIDSSPLLPSLRIHCYKN